MVTALCGHLSHWACGPQDTGLASRSEPGAEEGTHSRTVSDSETDPATRCSLPPALLVLTSDGDAVPRVTECTRQVPTPKARAGQPDAPFPAPSAPLEDTEQSPGRFLGISPSFSHWCTSSATPLLSDPFLNPSHRRSLPEPLS